MAELKYDLIVIGGGPAGLTASIYASRASLKTFLLAGDPPGGQLTLTTEIENFPGFPQGIQGPELIQNMRLQAEKFGTVGKNENVTKISGDATSGFELLTESGSIYSSQAIIIATGADAQWLGLESEQKLRGRGVSACATCDAFFFKNKVVAVVGAGDVAMEDASFLTKFSSKVYVLVRRSKEEMKASKFMRDKAFANPKIEFLFNTEVSNVLGNESVKGLEVINNTTQEKKILTDVEGLFVAIGHKPATGFLQGFIELDKVGYIKLTDNTKTSKEGVFVAGDAADYRYRQAISAAGMGCMAALDAEKFLLHKS